MKFERRNAYTIIELLITLSICGILAAVLLPVFSRPREIRCGSSCPSNLKQTGLGFLQYVQDYDEHLPPIALHNTASETQPYGWADALQPYLKSKHIFHCPSENEMSSTADPTQNGYTDYWFNANLNALAMRKIAAPNATFFAGDGNDGRDITNARYARGALRARQHDDAANYLFADGHVKTYLPKGAFQFENAP